MKARPRRVRPPDVTTTAHGGAASTPCPKRFAGCAIQNSRPSSRPGEIGARNTIGRSRNALIASRNCGRSLRRYTKRSSASRRRRRTDAAPRPRNCKRRLSSYVKQGRTERYSAHLPQRPLSSTSVRARIDDFFEPGNGLISTLTSVRQVTSPQSTQTKCGCSASCSWPLRRIS